MALLHNNHSEVVCNRYMQLQLPNTFSHRKNMINLSNRLLKKVVGKLNRMKKRKNMKYKPKRLRSTKDMTRDLGSTITMHLQSSVQGYMYIISNNNNNNTIVQPT